MQFVIMDLEWNNTYAKKTKGYLNEIIEIGAVKLSEDMVITGTFSLVIRSQIGKKLRGSVKRLTNLTNDDISTGIPFTKAFSNFRKWLGNEKTVILTWGDGDVRVLIENYTYLNGIKTIPFLKQYCDLQACFQRKFKTSPRQQIGLCAAAELLGINPDDFTQHRALGDSMLTAEVFSGIYNEKDFAPFIRECDDDFYRRLSFKPKVIRNIDNPLVDKSKLCHTCSACGTVCEIVDEWKYHNQFFRATYHCGNCDVDYAVKVKFRKLYDCVEFRKIESIIEPSEAEEPTEEAQQGE